MRNQEPCTFHAGTTVVRCSHLGENFVALYPDPQEAGIWVVTYGHTTQRGSVSSPIDEPRKDWAFEDYERTWLFTEGHPAR